MANSTHLCDPILRQVVADLDAIYRAGRWPDFNDSIMNHHAEQNRRWRDGFSGRSYAKTIGGLVANLLGVDRRLADQAAEEHVTGVGPLAMADELHQFANRIRRATPALKVRHAM